MVEVLHQGTSLTCDSLRAVTGAGLRDVMSERVRQIDAEGFTLAHDREHEAGEIAAAAISYLNTGADQLNGYDCPASEVPDTWPWSPDWWRPGDARRNIVKGMALMLAVLDRGDTA